VLDAGSRRRASTLKDLNVTAIDALGRDTGSIDALGGFSFSSQDGTGGTRIFTDPVGNQWRYVSDGLGRETVRTDPAGKATTTSYDAVGRMTTVTDRDSRVMQYSYDSADRVTSAVWKSAAGATVNLLTYTYDDNDNRLSARDSSGAVTYSYDELNRARTYTNVFGQVLTYSYDAEDRATKREDSLGGVQTSTYNAVGLLSSRQFGGSGQTPVRVDFAYTDRYEQSTLTRYSDVAGTTVVGTSVYAYDDEGHLTSIVNKNGAAATLSYYTYGYDSAMGQLALGPAPSARPLLRHALRYDTTSQRSAHQPHHGRLPDRHGQPMSKSRDLTTPTTTRATSPRRARGRARRRGTIRGITPTG
jgi:YD repeat-containing protein